MPLAPVITSRDNPLLKELKGLAERAKSRRESGRTLLDGEHLLEEACGAGLDVERLVFAEEYAHAPYWQQRLSRVPVTILSHGLFQALSPVSAPIGLLAVLRIPAAQDDAEGDAILIENVQDPGNLGAILRTAAAAGFRQAYLSTGCSEAWSPKALRGGQGAQFRLNIHEQAELADVARGFPGEVMAAALGASASLYDLDMEGPVAFAFGNEGAGLSDALLAEAQAFSIPMPGGMESLNVAAAAAVCLFERVRRERARRA